MLDLIAKYELLRRYTSDPLLIEAVLDYAQNRFLADSLSSQLRQFPLPDESFVSDWLRYEEASKQDGVFETLKRYFPQLRFPIAKGISKSDEYRRATLMGRPQKEGTQSGLKLRAPEALRLQIHTSIAGRIPVLITDHEDDFCSLIQTFSYKNEPVAIPGSMGAAIVSGIISWDRINTYRQQWQQDNPFGDWMVEFYNTIIPRKSDFQDKLIILSTKPYSGVPASQLSLDRAQWLSKSLEIRLAHECTHLFTQRYYGRMANHMHDELIADYMGILKVLGKFESRWFLTFIGLEDFPRYRNGGRLENYLGKSSVTGMFAVLKSILVDAARNVALFDDYLGTPVNEMDIIARLLSLCSLDLVELSAAGSPEQLIAIYQAKHIEQFRYDPCED